MTAMAGVMVLTPGGAVPPDLQHALVASLSREPDAPLRVASGPGYALVKLDLGILGGEACLGDADGTVAGLAGEPLLARGDAHRSRADDLRMLHDAWKQGAADGVLRDARGSFCSVHLDPAARRISLVSDRLGLRPLYYARMGDRVVFATSLRVLEALPQVSRTLDLRGVAEIAAFGFPLGTRSPYAEVSVIDAAEIVEACDAHLQRRHYWRWENLPPSELPEADLSRMLYERFRDAVRCRLGAQRSVVSFLSGGLDSRCIVACLRELGVEVHSMNFAPRGSADLVLGRMAAEALGTRHFELTEGPLDFWERMIPLHASWQRQIAPREGPERPRALWSGDGGSCGLGHIYLTERIVGLMRAGELDAAIATFCAYNGIGLSRRAFVRASAEDVSATPRRGMRDELGRLADVEAGRRIHLFLMYNGQRRLLARHYEDIDRRRFELVTPFFDPLFLELVLASPIDPFLRHKLYVRWLKEFPPAVTSVPWQAYPGHEPCPLPQPAGLRGQWESWYTDTERKAIRRAAVAGIGRDLANPRFPGWVLDKRSLRLARWLTRLGVGDYSYLFKIAQEFTRYASRADPPAGRDARMRS